jgi:hypothetical protein
VCADGDAADHREQAEQDHEGQGERAAADGPSADHDIMDTPDINFSAVLLPSAAARAARR